MKEFTRRGLIKSLFTLSSCAVLSPNVFAASITPPSAEGPFYPTAAMRMADVDNDLVKVLGAVEQAGGEVISLKGQLRSKDGLPLTGYRIEIWQCDINGKYLHPSDDRNVAYDSGFQGFGHDVTDANGSYSFRTIKPTVYPGRTPHIHVKVLDAKQALLTTQFYIAGDERNQSDSLYRRMTHAQAKSVSMVFKENNALSETRIDIVI
jgi:protocatechuate 3,4-dioxygenase beta subunit